MATPVGRNADVECSRGRGSADTRLSPTPVYVPGAHWRCTRRLPRTNDHTDHGARPTPPRRCRAPGRGCGGPAARLGPDPGTPSPAPLPSSSLGHPVALTSHPRCATWRNDRAFGTQGAVSSNQPTRRPLITTFGAQITRSSETDPSARSAEPGRRQSRRGRRSRPQGYGVPFHFLWLSGCLLTALIIA